MAELIWNDVEIVVNSVDLSDHTRSASLTYSVEMLDITAMGDGARSRIAGFKEWSIDCEFNQDFAAAKTDATLFPLVGAAEFPITLMPVKTGGVSATNPKYTGNAVLENYPFGGAVGEVGTVSVTFSGSGTLTRATS
jgi:predicted secreted protein